MANSTIKSKVLTFLACLAFLAFLTAPVFADDYALYQKSGHKSPSWDGLVKAGFESFDGGDVETAFAFLEKAYTQGCRDGLLLFKLALYYESGKEYAKAAATFKEALPRLQSQYPDYKETKKLHEHLGRIYYQADQFDLAMPELNLALKNDPDNFMLLFMSGQIYRVKKDYAKAKELFEKALTVKMPTNIKPDPKTTVLTELMMLTYQLKEYDDCLRYIDQILAINPADATAASYKQDIQTKKFKQRQMEAIKKMTE